MKKCFQQFNNSQIVYPNDILNGKLYYGNWKHAASQEVIDNIGLTHILNMTSEVENFFQLNPQISYLKISIDDEDFTNISQHFKESWEFISNALQDNKNKILIHCAQGKSRSATIVCMYLMKKFKLGFEYVFLYIYYFLFQQLYQILSYVQSRRDVACPNYGFIEQLKQFEKNNFEFF
ncbi:hypothetical protein IMG5_105980 [Ichthyophthirius multifiliis]|uniref:protein-tyrosine-phosphatase n=1 Tax=Ichthyophthirius multifiliis TaxID=5932 RepID=G0QT41_ICHMU|nr:hypothetical protein IMG5_105980 [Ichthyophthirius multifiliis]EGR31616.1 hypothetical protein IMG5_105980 [Ichthyophthirius multifiliis]|eukprot:XP_004035102.1 hypothetical protein IMG5_105980 [Ichthyophthirius multifiliis]